MVGVMFTKPFVNIGSVTDVKFIKAFSIKDVEIVTHIQKKPLQMKWLM